MVFEPRCFDLDVARTGRDCQRYSWLAAPGKTFSNMAKTVAAGEMHNSFAAPVARLRRI